MKLKEDFSIRKVGDDYMMVSESASSLDYTRVISLNSTAAYLIEETKQKHFSKEDWVNLLIDKYDVEKEIAEEDIDILVNKLIIEGLAEED